MTAGLCAVLVVVAAAVLWYADVCLHPWRKCPRCGGDRRNAGSTGERWGDCGRCGTSGKVRRFGARGQR